MKKQILTIVTTLLFVVNANAIVELRAGYGILTPAEDEVGADTLKTFTGFNVDAIVELPLVPFGFGLRYEDMGSALEISGQEFDASFKRTSLLINYRFIDMFLYAGVIGSLGFVNDASLDLPAPSGTVDLDTSLTYSVGAEAGVSLGLIMIGAELGYLVADLSGDGGAEADLSGIYAKALVGVGF